MTGFPQTAPRVRIMRRIAYLLNYDPCWFAEAISGGALALWGLIAIATHDGDPITNLLLALFGLWRLVLLLRLALMCRVLAAAACFVLWAGLASTAVQFFPHQAVGGLMAMLALADLFTVGKFTLLARRHATRQMQAP